MSAGYSQRRLAEVAGVHQSAVARIESGKENPTLERTRRLVEAAGSTLQVRVEPRPDQHDLSLIETTIRLTPVERIRRLVRLHQVSRQLSEAAAKASRKE